ncbi:MAG TPA: calcium-binding protein [Polyangia bacterium]
MAVSCGEADPGQEGAPGVGTNPPTGAMSPAASTAENTEGIELTAPLLAGACTLTATNMAVAVADGESALLTLRTSDNKITLNAATAGAAPCEITAVGSTITITSSGTTAATGRTVILDYINGLFAKGTMAAPGITVDFDVTTDGANDTVKVRGTTGVDSFAFGLGATTGYAMNVNAGMTAPNDAFPDVVFKQVEKLIVNSGDGADTLTGAGTFGTTAVYPAVMRLYGGAGNDTITGGSAADHIYGGSNNDTMDGAAGNDTFYMGSTADGTDVINAAGSTPGNDTVSYADRTANLTINVDGTATSGAAGGENDTISDKIVNIIGGSGNDTITVGSMSTVVHNVSGGDGHDSFTGGGSADVFDGQGGDDVCLGAKVSMSYASRSTNITVTVCDPGGSCTASNNDGDQTATLAQKNGTGGTATDLGTSSDDEITIGGLTGMTANDVGRVIRLTGFTGEPLNDDGTTGYEIIGFTDANTVDIDVSGNASFDETDLAATSNLTWAVLGAEKDNVQCANVVGGTLVDTITGDARNNIIKGGNGNDVLAGGDGDDNLNGEAGDDGMHGGAGSDTLVGGAGTDTLVGGDGDDILQGDAGTDTFTCDGANASGGGAGTAPGDTDFTVDVGAGETAGTGCDTF